MKGGYCYYILAILHVCSWISATSRPSALYEGPHQQGQVLMSFQASLDSKQRNKSMVKIIDDEKANRRLRALGSRPPNCEHKCGSCKPCIAVQVPTRTSHMRVQYANYEPEGWQCKCGTSFYDP